MATLNSLDIVKIHESTFQLTSLNLDQILILTDDCNRMKIFKYPEVYQLITFFSPYKSLFKYTLDMTPNCLVTLLEDGSIDFITLDSIVPSIYESVKLLIQEKLRDKKAYKLVKIDKDTFGVIDDYFTHLYICQLNGLEIKQEKLIDISKYGLIDNKKKYYSNRNVEIFKDGQDNYLTLIYGIDTEESVIERKNTCDDENNLEKICRLTNKVEAFVIKITW